MLYGTVKEGIEIDGVHINFTTGLKWVGEVLD
jgi:hypothetical protein